ncbi:VOC family protein [Daejeonella sp.]|uniref:VOC family protein n=1 Tax=Daejeonella sp. TaxID=2805397 RepID=UPI0030C5D379
MATNIFVNIPVKNLKKSMDFFAALGYQFNPNFTNDEGACMVVSDTIYVMLLVERFFKTFTTKEICDASKNTESIICLSVEKKDQVEEMIDKAVAAGGSIYSEPQDHGFMYQHAFQDLDNHLWEIVWLNPDAALA